MGTRGVYGFERDGVKKITYNHYDSYPSALGKDVVSFIKKHSVDDLNKIFDNIFLVDKDATLNHLMN